MLQIQNFGFVTFVRNVGDTPTPPKKARLIDSKDVRLDDNATMHEYGTGSTPSTLW